MTGNLQQRGPSAWRLRVFLGRDATGKKRYLERSFRGTKRDAQRALSRLLVEVDEGRHAAAAPMRFGELLDRWLDLKETVVEASTVASYRWIADRYLRAPLGSLPVARIRPFELDALYAVLLRGGGAAGRPLSARTVRLCHTVVRQSLEQARRWGLIARNPAVDATPPRGRRSEIHPPPSERVRSLLEVAAASDIEFALLLRVLAATGCRRGEALALRWTDIDTERGELVISRSVAMVGGQALEKDTKTHQARRLALDPGTVIALIGFRERCAAQAQLLGVELADDALLFSNDDRRQRPWRPDVTTNRFIRFCRKEGIDGMRLHDLRHFVATNLGAAGTPIATISARLGHRDRATTLNVYSHSLPSADRGAADTMGELLEPRVSLD